MKVVPDNAGLLAGDLGLDLPPIGRLVGRLETLRRRSPYLAPLAAIAGLALLDFLVTRRVTEQSLAAAPPAVRMFSMVLLWVGYVLAPVVALAKAAALAAIAWAVCTLLEMPARWRLLLSALLYSEVVVGAGGTATILALGRRGAADAAAAKANPPGFIALAAHINVTFLVWAVVATVFFRAAFRWHPARAFVVVFTLFAARVAFDLLRVSWLQ